MKKTITTTLGNDILRQAQFELKQEKVTKFTAQMKEIVKERDQAQRIVDKLNEDIESIVSVLNSI